MAECNPQTYPNLDLSQAFDFASVEEYVADPQISCEGDIAIPIDTLDPIYALEVVLAKRFGCAIDPSTEMPFMTFPLGSTNTSLMRVYEKSFSTSPGLVVARVAINAAASAEVTYVVPVAVTGHRTKAVVGASTYSAVKVDRGSKTDDRYELGRSTPKAPRIVTNPFYVKADPQPASRFVRGDSARARADSSVVSGIRRGMLGTN